MKLRVLFRLTKDSRVMFSIHSTILFALLLLICGAGSVCAQVRLGTEDADRLLIEKVDPTYPAMAKIMKLQGAAKVELTVSETGNVTAAKLVSGDVVFKMAALEAAKKRKYRPYTSHGKPVSFVTTIEFQFSLGIPIDKYKLDHKISEQFFKEEHQCRDLIRTQRWKEAETSCRAAIALANQFPYERELEKSGAYELFGMTMVGQKRFREAIESYNHALDVIRTRLTEKDAEVGQLYGHIAIAYHLLGDLNKARESYRKAENIYQVADANIGQGNSDEEIERTKQGYMRTLKNLLKLHLTAAEDAGATAEVDELKALMKRLP